MKRIGTILCGWVIGVALWGCVKEADVHTAHNGQEIGFTVDAAKSFFATNVSSLEMIRLSNQPGATEPVFKSVGIFPDFYPLWEEATSYRHRYADVVEMPLQSSTPYQAVLSTVKEGTPGQWSQRQVFLKLVIEKHIDEDKTVAVVAHFLPDDGYVSQHGADAVYRLDHRPHSESGFTGVILFSYPDGTFIRGHQYRDGQPVHMIYPQWQVQQKNIGSPELFNYRIFFTGMLTRQGGIDAANQGDGWGWCMCGEVHHFESPCAADLTVHGSRQEDTDDPNADDGSYSGGYGSVWNPWEGPGPDEPGDSGGSSPPPTDEKKEQDRKNLEKIKLCDEWIQLQAQNCMNVFNAFKNAGMQSFVDQYKGAEKEYGIVLERQNGRYSLSKVYEAQNRYNSVSVLTYPSSLAMIHNHPKSSPPSLTDVLGLAKIYENYRHMASVYVVTRDETIYAIHIENGTKAIEFANNHEMDSIKRKEFGDRMTVAINEMAKGLNYPNDYYNELYTYAMAHLMDEYDTGINVFKLEPAGFIHKQAVRNTDETNKVLFDRLTCPY